MIEFFADDCYYIKRTIYNIDSPENCVYTGESVTDDEYIGKEITVYYKDIIIYGICKRLESFCIIGGSKKGKRIGLLIEEIYRITTLACSA